MTTTLPHAKLIILDRDGVINLDSPHFIKSPEEWIPIPGSLEAIAALNQAGFKVIVATNQSGIARGLFSQKCLDNIHKKIQTLLALQHGKIDQFYICPHGPLDNCECRKPKPGLLHQIEKDYTHHFTANPTYCIGDSLRDLEAAQAANAIPLLVGTGNGYKTQKLLTGTLKNIPFFNNLALAVRSILKEHTI